MRADIVIDDARGADDIAAAKCLFEAYAASLDVDLCFQNFAHELATLPGDYAPPTGCLLLARVRDEAVGCVALRPLGSGTGEIKRLYVDRTWHGAGIGRALANAVIARARAIGYDEVKLDTLATMRAARALYASLGFRECTPYYDNPLPGVAYMSLALAR